MLSKNLSSGGFCGSNGSQSDNEGKRKNYQICEPCQKTRKKQTVLSIVTGALETVPKSLEKRLEELEIRRRIETILNAGPLRLARKLRRLKEIGGNFLSLRRWGEKLARSEIIIIILFTNPSARAGYDTRSIFKRSLTGLNSQFSFS